MSDYPAELARVVRLLSEHRLFGTADDDYDEHECGCGAKPVANGEDEYEDFAELIWHEAHVGDALMRGLPCERSNHENREILMSNICDRCGHWHPNPDQTCLHWCACPNLRSGTRTLTADATRDNLDAKLSVPESWVQKAADAITIYCGTCICEGVKCDTCDAAARAVLDAVAPTIRADAWDEGKHSEHDPNCRINGYPDECICPNPYREVAQ